MTAGIVFFAYNTEQIDYVKLAVLAAGYVKHYMPGRSVCLITNAGSWEWFEKNEKNALSEKVFDEIVLVEPESEINKRVHWDSPWASFTSDFKNSNKHKVIKYSPYDQTLLLDLDYIVQNDSLDYVFDSGSAVTLFKEARSLVGELPPQAQRYLHESGIPMVWSTAIYFDRRQPIAEIFFDLWAHVKDHYEFYKFLYGFPGSLYRTDYCVSIATHIMNGMNTGNVIEYFPQPMINMSQFDDIAKINQVDEWVYLVNDSKENWKDTLALIKKENVHVMNKRALERQYDSILDHIGDKL